MVHQVAARGGVPAPCYVGRVRSVRPCFAIGCGKQTSNTTAKRPHTGLFHSYRISQRAIQQGCMLFLVVPAMHGRLRLEVGL